MSGIIGSAGSKSGIIGTTELDYEEGTWTPNMSGNSGDPTIDGVAINSNPATGYGDRDGSYTKIGNRVTLQFRLHLAGSGTIGDGVGAMLITNLPFTASSASVLQAAGSCGRYGSWTHGDHNPSNLFLETSTAIGAKSYSDNDVSSTHIGNYTNLSGTITYSI